MDEKSPVGLKTLLRLPRTGRAEMGRKPEQPPMVFLPASPCGSVPRTPRVYQLSDLAQRIKAALGHVFQRRPSGEQDVRIPKSDPAVGQRFSTADVQGLVDPDQAGDAQELLLAEHLGIQILDFRSRREAEELPGFYARRLPDTHDPGEELERRRP